METKYNKISLYIRLICLVLGAVMVACVFMPLLTHRHESDKSNGLGNFSGIEALQGGFYPGAENDEYVVDETGAAYVKYEAMSENARVFYDQFVFLTDNGEGRTAAMFFLFAVVLGGIVIALSALIKENLFLWQAAASAISVACTIVSMVFVDKLTQYVYVGLSIKSHYVVYVGGGLICLLVCGAVATVLSVFGFILTKRKTL